MNPNVKKITNRQLSGLFFSKERDYFLENLSMLIAGGVPIINALTVIAQDVRSRWMKNVISSIKEDIESGSTLWYALSQSRLFPDHAVALIRIGEESGKLTENLIVLAIEQEKDRVYKSKLHSAMIYPVLVFGFTVVIGISIIWFILPKLATVFTQLQIDLPLITQVLIKLGTFLGAYGQYVVPALIVLVAVLFYVLFFFNKTKFLGHALLNFIPGVKRIIKEVEMARFGYLLGTLLEAGLPIVQALDSLAQVTEISQYKKLYLHLSNAVTDGNSFQKSFAAFKNINHLISAPIQKLIIAGEHSGALASTLLKVGQSYEIKADLTAKNLAVILEPILLVIVWLGVVAVALAVILPIYSLIGSFNT